MNGKNITILVLVISVTIGIIALISSSDSNVSEKLAYSKIDESRNAQVAELDLTEDDLGLEDTTKQIVGGDKDEYGCIGSAGYTWCEEKKKCLRLWEEPCVQDGVFEFLQEMESTTGIEFSGSMPREFEWKTQQGGLKIQGRRYDSIRIAFDDAQKVDRFLKNKGYKIDLSNTEAGTVSTTTGYVKQPMLCLSISGPTGYKYASEDDWEPPEPNLYDIEVYCGLIPTQQQQQKR